MDYTISYQDLKSITDLDVAFSTTKLLPKWEDVPEPFRKGNEYTNLAEAIFYGSKLPNFTMNFNADLSQYDPAEVSFLVNRCVCAHISSFAPKHEHKIAGVGYMIRAICELVSEK